MATFITTVKFTPQGMTNIQDTCKRAAAFKAAARKMGGQDNRPVLDAGAF